MFYLVNFNIRVKAINQFKIKIVGIEVFFDFFNFKESKD